MDATALALAARMARLRLRPARLALGAAMGTTPTVMLLVLGTRAPVWPLLLLLPLAMCAAAFWPIPRRFLGKAMLWTYGATVALGGLVLALVGLGAPLLFALVVSALTLLSAASWWVQQVSRPLARVRGLIPLKIWLEGRPIRISALLDTGNQLRDPILGRPVIIVGREALWPALSPQRREWVQAVLSGQGELAGAESGGLGGIVHIVSAAGRRALPVMVAQHIEVEVNSGWQVLMPLAVGVTDSILSQTGEFQALLNPSTLTEPRRVGA